jgi:hypothetical protein
MELSKVDLALIAIVAAALIWFESGHRVAVGTLAAPAQAAPAVAPCPNTDDAPFSAECIKFITGGTSPGMLSGASWHP